MRACVLIAIVLSASTASAENCKPREKVRLEGGRPCWDVSASYGDLATWLAPGLSDLRLDVMRMAFFTHDAKTADVRFVLGDAETVAGRDGAWNASVVGLSYGRDHEDWGWYAMGRLVTRTGGAYRLVTPAVGLRIGDFERAALVGEARFDGVRALDLSKTEGMSVARDFDLRARATAVVQPWLRLEARGRLRDATFGDRHVRDAFGAAGVELAVAGKDGFRVMPLFVGLGARRVIADANPMSSAPPSWQLLLWFEIEAAVNSSRAVW